MNQKPKKTFVCLGCEKTCVWLKGRKGKYCSHTCQQIHFHQKFIDDWKSGRINAITSDGTSQHIKKYLLMKQAGACSVCKNTMWCGAPIPLELEHKDGNSFNNAEENVSLLCCNCHSQTDTYKGRNRGNGRLARSKTIVGAV